MKRKRKENSSYFLSKASRVGGPQTKSWGSLKSSVLYTSQSVTQQNASNSEKKNPHHYPWAQEQQHISYQLLCRCSSKRQIVFIKTTAKTWCVLQSKGRWTIKRVPLTLDGEGSLSLSLSQIFLFLSYFLNKFYIVGE